MSLRPDDCQEQRAAQFHLVTNHTGNLRADFRTRWLNLCLIDLSEECLCRTKTTRAHHPLMERGKYICNTILELPPPTFMATVSGILMYRIYIPNHRFVGTFNNTFPPALGIYVTLGLPANDCTIALLASIFLNATNASPAFSRDREIVAAASASPSARITAACRSCSAWGCGVRKHLCNVERTTCLLNNELCSFGIYGRIQCLVKLQ